MSLPTNIAKATIDTVLARLTPLFLIGAANDETLARQAATEMLAGYHPETADELTLAAETISLRLRGSAVSLSRESHKSQRKLDQLQKDRRAGAPPPVAEAPKPDPKIDQALNLIEAARKAIQNNGKGQTWAQSFQKRQTAKRIADNLKKKQTAHPAPPKTHFPLDNPTANT